MRKWHINASIGWSMVFGIAYTPGKSVGLDRGFVTIWIGPVAFSFGPNAQPVWEQNEKAA